MCLIANQEVTTAMKAIEADLTVYKVAVRTPTRLAGLYRRNSSYNPGIIYARKYGKIMRRDEVTRPILEKSSVNYGIHACLSRNDAETLAARYTRHNPNTDVRIVVMKANTSDLLAVGRQDGIYDQRECSQAVFTKVRLTKAEYDKARKPKKKK